MNWSWSTIILGLAPYLCPFSLLSWFQKHKGQPWTPLGSACFGVAIYGPWCDQNTKDMVEFSKLICFDHNFLPNAVINFIFRQVIYTFPNLSIDAHIGHNYGHIWWCHSGHSDILAVMERPFMAKKIGQPICLLKDCKNCRSPVEKLNWLLY